MTNINRLVEVVDFLGDVLAVIGDALESLGDIGKIERARDGRGVLEHEAS